MDHVEHWPISARRFQQIASLITGNKREDVAGFGAKSEQFA